jgi:ATP/maltotriose-dependent transcriptional regulator MalT
VAPHAARLDELITLAGLDASVRAETLGVIAIDATADEARLAHPLYGEALRFELGALRAQRLRRRLADALLERDPVTPETAMRAARLFEGLDAGEVVLTKREAQLVGLARDGISNAEIADRLVVSVRTVESHLYRAMQKLGVSDRRDL